MVVGSFIQQRSWLMITKQAEAKSRKKSSVLSHRGMVLVDEVGDDFDVAELDDLELDEDDGGYDASAGLKVRHALCAACAAP